MGINPPRKNSPNHTENCIYINDVTAGSSLKACSIRKPAPNYKPCYRRWRHRNPAPNTVQIHGTPVNATVTLSPTSSTSPYTATSSPPKQENYRISWSPSTTKLSNRVSVKPVSTSSVTFPHPKHDVSPATPTLFRSVWVPK